MGSAEKAVKQRAVKIEDCLRKKQAEGSREGLGKEGKLCLGEKRGGRESGA